VQPNNQYPYGMKKIKNFKALPRGPFLYFGSHIYYDSTQDLLNNNFEHSETNINDIYLLIYWVWDWDCSCVTEYEGFVEFDKELGGVGIRRNSAQYNFEKDPLLIAILYENIFTLLSTSIPIFTTILNIFFHNPYIPYLGICL